MKNDRVYSRPGLQDFFRKNGYFRVEEAVDESFCSEARSVALTTRRYPPELIDRDSTGRAIRLEGVGQNLGISEGFAGSRLAASMNSLLGVDWLIILNRHNHFTVDYGVGNKSTSFHRDALHWTRGYVTILIMISSNSHHTNWPRVIPSSHLWPISGPANGGGYWLEQDDNSDLSDQALPAPLAARDALLLDPLTFHAAGIGLATEPRIVLTLAARAGDELSRQDAANEMRISGEHVYRGQPKWRSGSEELSIVGYRHGNPEASINVKWLRPLAVHIRSDFRLERRERLRDDR